MERQVCNTEEAICWSNLSKLNYAGFLIQTTARTHLNAIDRIQYSAARIMLGALKYTPKSYLEIEANLMPLHLVRKESMVKYAARILTV